MSVLCTVAMPLIQMPWYAPVSSAVASLSLMYHWVMYHCLIGPLGKACQAKHQTVASPLTVMAMSPDGAAAMQMLSQAAEWQSRASCEMHSCMQKAVREDGDCGLKILLPSYEFKCMKLLKIQA